jgi:pimeloyl-ACP methyl ester carboxylesterase
MTPYWLDKSEYPFESHFFEVDGRRLHYIDEGEGEALLFVHGTPSWSFDFRKVILALRPAYRCVAIDHIGFGLSDKPGEYDYSAANHSRTLERFILEKQLRRFTLVVHDFGGPIGLDVAMRHPDRIDTLVVMNSWLWSSESDPDFIKLKRILKSPLLPLLYRYLNFSPRFLLPASFGEKKLSKKLLKQYTKPFGRPGERSGPLAFARSLLEDQNWFESLWNNKEVIAGKPTLFVWGMKDPAVKPHNLEKFRLGFPNSHILRLEDCGHFPQEERPEEVVAAIRTFLHEKAGQNAARS